MGKAGGKITLNRPIFHLGMDFYQGLAGSRLFSRYHIIAYRNNRAIRRLRKEGVRVFTLSDKLKPNETVPRSSGHLLSHPLVEEYINRAAGAEQAVISFYKPSPKIEILAGKNNWLVAGNSSRLNRKLENKINFSQLLAKNKAILTPKTIITQGQKIKSRPIVSRLGLPVVVQSPRGWSGRSTYLADTKQKLEKILQKINGAVKISRYIPGLAITTNAVIARDGRVIQSDPAYQLTGESELTSLPMATCGRAWPAKLEPEAVRQIKASTELVGGIIGRLGFRGFFGLDFVFDPQDKKTYLIEINPRLTASFPFYTLLEIQAGLTPLLLRHYQCFIDFDIAGRRNSEEKRDRIEGTEIVQRSRQKKSLVVKKTLASGGYSNKQKRTSKLDPTSNLLTLTAPEPGESIRFNQEVFKISTKKQILINKGGRTTLSQRTKKDLKFFRENIS